MPKAKQRPASPPPARKPRPIATGGVIYDDLFYPLTDALPFIGVGNSQLYEHVAAGRLPKPVPPCAGSSKRGYYGRTIKEIQAANS
jgi:hypothetical protein